MGLTVVDQNLKCFHCGEVCASTILQVDSKPFCCHGCKAVYEILSSSGLSTYYQLESFPGIKTTNRDEHKYAYLDNPQVTDRLLDFSSQRLEKVRFYIPEIHCSSCIWLLENLSRLNPGVLGSRANLSDRELAVDYDPEIVSLRQLVELLATIGYEPAINLEQRKQHQEHKSNRRLLLKIAVAGFCFGNIMLLSFPEYLGLDIASDLQLASWFSWIILLLSLPVLFYCAKGYFKSALNGIRQRYLNIDVPISLGILALAGRSYYEIIFGLGPGYLDSLAGLLFLLLLGKWFQQRTYRTLSFSRDFKDYFPLAVTKLDQGKDKVVLVDQLQPGDIIMVRNQELIPADSVLIDPVASIDYSFVTGESQTVSCKEGDKIYAGGRHQGQQARYEVIKRVSQSYLTQLWNHQAFSEPEQDSRQLLINAISKYFTLVVLLIAVCSSVYWLFIEPAKSLFVFTSVLIVACPCALAMATPFTLGQVLRVMGKNRLYLKNAQVVDSISRINSIIFDKTGTLTKSGADIKFSTELSTEQASLIAALVVNSNHPVSRNIYTYLTKNFSLKLPMPEMKGYQELPGKGICARIDGYWLKLGSAQFLGVDNAQATGTYVSIDGQIIGHFTYNPEFRRGVSEVVERLRNKFKLAVLSGDQDHKQDNLMGFLPGVSSWEFNQAPMDKLSRIERMQQDGDKVMMVGDGLNDAGALQISQVGLAVTENPQHFTPASDGILHASSLGKLYRFIRLANWSQIIIISGFVLSFLYNIIGLSFAVSGNLTPLTAAILMPVSSISVVIFSTVAVRLAALKLKLA